MSMSQKATPWKKAVLEARPILWRLAGSGQMIACQELAEQIRAVKMPYRGRTFKRFLNDICRFEFEVNPKAPMLTAVVYSKHRNLPGPGFFQLASERYGRSIPEATWGRFWRDELRRLHEYAASRPIEQVIDMGG